jgi:tetratricopeptide (TPR) repeat protein
MQARELQARSGELLRRGEQAKALKALEEALDLDASSAWAWAHRGDILYVHFGRYWEAIECFSRAIALDSNYAWALAHRGAAYERLNRFVEAEEDLVKALHIRPTYTWVLAMLARVYQMTGRFREAFSAVEQVVERDHSLLPHWREERAMMRMLVRRHEDAEVHFQIALRADPEDRFAHYNSVVNLVFWRGLDAAMNSISALKVRLNASIRAGTNSRDVDRSVYELGGLAALEGDSSAALDYFASAIAREEGLVLLSPARKRARVDMAWDSLRSDVRFTQLIERHV